MHRHKWQMTLQRGAQESFVNRLRKACSTTALLLPLPARQAALKLRFQFWVVGVSAAMNHKRAGIGPHAQHLLRLRNKNILAPSSVPQDSAARRCERAVHAARSARTNAWLGEPGHLPSALPR